jgi:hypothetical protein
MYCKLLIIFHKLLIPLPYRNGQTKYRRLPETIIGDAGYGSEENYQYYVKYNYFDKKQSPKADIISIQSRHSLLQ